MEPDGRGKRPTDVAVLLVLVILAILGCATTTLTKSWRNPDYVGRPLNKLLVVGVTTDSDLRRSFEDQFVKELRAAGVEAVPSYVVLPEAGQAERAVLVQAISEAGTDGALITRLIRIDTETEVAPVFLSAGGFYGGYAAAWVGYYNVPVSHTDTVVLESDLYGLNEPELLSSMTTQTVVATDIHKYLHPFAQLIIGQLKEQKLI